MYKETAKCNQSQKIYDLRTPLVDLILKEESSRSKLSNTGKAVKLKAYKNTIYGLFATSINDTLIHFQQKKMLQATQWPICFKQK